MLVWAGCVAPLDVGSNQGPPPLDLSCLRVPPHSDQAGVTCFGPSINIVAGTRYWNLPNFSSLPESSPASRFSVEVELPDGGLAAPVGHERGEGLFEVCDIPDLPSEPDGGSLEAVRIHVTDWKQSLTVITTQRNFEFIDDQVGRPCTANTKGRDPLSLDLTGVSAAPGLGMSVFSPSSDFYATLDLDGLSLRNGRLQGAAPIVGGFGSPAQVGMDETTWVISSESWSDGGVTGSTDVSGASVSGVDLADGGTIDAELALGGSTAFVEVRVETGAYRSLAPQMLGLAPSTARPRLTTTFNAVPHQAGWPDVLTEAVAPLANFQLDADAPPDLQLLLAYQDVFPDEWKRDTELWFSTEGVIRAPNAAPSALAARIRDVHHALSLETLTPRLGPPRAVQLDHADAFGGGVLASRTPTLSWSAPDFGEPAGYWVDVWWVTADANQRTFVQRLHTFETDRPQLRLPAGLLASGHVYVFTVRASTSASWIAGSSNFDVAFAEAVTQQWVAP